MVSGLLLQEIVELRVGRNMALYAVPINLSYTPVITGSGTAGSGTYTTNVGGYTIINNICFYWLNITMTAHTGTGNFQVSLPPFTSVNVTNGRWAFNIALVDNMTSPVTTYVTGAMTNNATNILLQSETIQTGVNGALALDVACSIQGSGWYNIY